MSEYDSN